MRMDFSRAGIRCRQIGEADIAAVASCSTRGFPNRNAASGCTRCIG